MSKKKNLNEEFFTEKEMIPGVAFGPKNSWFAIKAKQIEIVWNELKSDFDIDVVSDFEEGIENGTYTHGLDYTLTKPINGWCLLVCRAGASYWDKIKLKNFEEVHFYSTYEDCGLLHISKIVNKEIVRDFLTSDCEVLKNVGEPTSIEKEIILNYKENNNDVSETETCVGPFLACDEVLFEIAENWSINPFTLDQIMIEDFAMQLKMKDWAPGPVLTGEF